MSLALSLAALGSIFVLGMSFLGVRPLGAALILVAALPVAFVVWAVFFMRFW